MADPNNVQAGVQAGLGPKFWARLLGAVNLPVASPTYSTGFTDVGGALVAGTAVVAAQPTALSRFIQNRDMATLVLTFDGGASIALGPAPDQDGGGEIWRDDGHRILGAITLTSTLPTHHFSAGWTDNS